MPTTSPQSVRRLALSLKQPWATLLAHGIKTIEVRVWPTPRRGLILIHASRTLDERPEAWKHVPPHLRAHAQQVGGVVGAGELTGCIAYRKRDDFVRDCPLHRNEPDWFRPSGLFGFAFRNLTPLPFVQVPGWMRFFEIEFPELVESAHSTH